MYILCLTCIPISDTAGTGGLLLVMSELSIVGEAILVGVCGYAALQHGVISIRRPIDRMHLLFSLVCLTAGFYFAGKLTEWSNIFVPWTITKRWDEVYGLAFYALLAWFVNEFTGVRGNWLLAGLSVVFVAAFWFPVFLILCLISVFVFSLYACIRQYKNGARRDAVILGIGMGFFLVMFFLKHALNSTVLQFHDIPQYGALVLIVVMGFHIMYELRVSEQKMHSVLENVPAAIYIKDSRGRFLWVNRNFEDLFDVARRKIVGRSDPGIFNESSGEGYGKEKIPLSINGNQEASEINVETGGKTLTYSFLKSSFSPSDGAEQGECGVLTDISRLRDTEIEVQTLRQQLWREDRVASIGAMTASIAHELNQPLAAILSNAQAAIRFLSAPSVEMDEIREILQDIVRDDKRAGQVIGALRNMLRRNEPMMKRIDLAEITREVLQLTRTEFMSSGIGVNVFCEGRCYVIADKVLIQQVQLNLIINAIEAMQASDDSAQVIDVSVVRDNDKQVTFMVRDNGVGLESNQSLNLFDMFRTSKPNGVGLGLAICRSIIDSHRGSIWYERNMGGGLTFFFRLPLAESVPDAANTVPV